MRKELLPVGFVASINDILGDASCDFGTATICPHPRARLNRLKAVHAADSVKPHPAIQADARALV